MALGFDIDVETSLDAAGAIRDAQRQRIEDAMDKGFAVSQEHVPEDRGTLRQSGFAPTWDGDSIRYGYQANHAAPMEFGTQPYYPPIKPLVEWAKRVAGDPGLGYAVQQKIAEEGIDAQPYMQPSTEAVRNWLQTHEFSEYLDREL
jgi:hypothetical protein